MRLCERRFISRPAEFYQHVANARRGRRQARPERDALVRTQAVLRPPHRPDIEFAPVFGAQGQPQIRHGRFTFTQVDNLACDQELLTVFSLPRGGRRTRSIDRPRRLTGIPMRAKTTAVAGAIETIVARAAIAVVAAMMKAAMTKAGADAADAFCIRAAAGHGREGVGVGRRRSCLLDNAIAVRVCAA
jgi:hypothetical protein